MKLSPMRLLCAAGLFGLCAAVPLSASARVQTSPIGTVKAVIDGKDYAGETLAVPSEDSATAHFRTFGPVTNLAIQAQDPEAERRMHNVLTLEISVMGEGAGAQITASSASYWPDGMSAPFYTSEEGAGAASITLEAFSLESGAARAAGSFEATLCAKESYFAEIDLEDCLPVEGVFDTALRKAD